MTPPYTLPTRAFAALRRTVQLTQRGFALVTALLFLIILSILAVTMFGSSGMQGKIAGNTLEYQRAMQAAEYALRYGEWLLQQRGLTETTCTQMVDLSVVGNQPMVCLNALANPTTLPWSAGLNLTPVGMTVRAGGGEVFTPGYTGPTDVNYARQPSLYIYKVGPDPSGNMMYQLSTVGYGGNSGTVSVLQAMVSVSP